ncbi:MAG: efflux RND transporter permease subunit, partial [Planctomycetota bacterium]
MAAHSALRVYRLNQCLEEFAGDHPELEELRPPKIDLERLRKLSVDFVEPRFERVAGVSDARTFGGREEEMQVIVDPAKLAARKITIAQVRDALRQQNSDSTAGDVLQGKRSWVIRTLGRFRDPEQIKAQLLVSDQNSRVYIGDVADVRLGFKKRESVARRYGTETTGVSISRVSGANVLEVMKGLRQACDELNEGFLAREGLELFQYYDETLYIESSIQLVIRNMLIGSAATIAILMLFLHFGQATILASIAIAVSAVAAIYLSPWFYLLTLLLIFFAGYRLARGALVAAVAIPISICGAFLCLTLLGRSLNVISLAGMAFAVGMLVDNSVVVLENITRRRQLGESSWEAAAKGVAEVSGAILASTLTTIAVFLPVIFVEATAGQLFRDIAIAISCGIAFSMLVSFTVIPTSAAALLRRGSGNAAVGSLAGGHGDEATVPLSPRGLTGVIQSSAAGAVMKIVTFNRWILSSRLRSITVVVVMTGASIGVSYLLWPKVEYLPTGNRNFVFARFSLPPGYNIDELSKVGAVMEKRLQPYWDVDEGGDASDGTEHPVLDYYFCAIFDRSLFMGFRARDEERASELVPMVREAGKDLPGIRVLASQSSLFGRGLTGGRTIDVEISGPDLERLVAIAAGVLDDVDRLMPGGQASAEPSLELSSPEVHLRPKLVAASEMGIDSTNLGYVVNALVDGAYAGDYYIGGEKIDLTIRGQSDAGSPNEIMSLPLSTQYGQIVPLLAVAEMKYASGPEKIARRERLRSITVQVSPPDEMPLEAAMDLVNDQIVAPRIEDGTIGNEYFVALSGTADKLRQAWDALRFNFVLALIIT